MKKNLREITYAAGSKDRGGGQLKAIVLFFIFFGLLVSGSNCLKPAQDIVSNSSSSVTFTVTSSNGTKSVVLNPGASKNVRIRPTSITKFEEELIWDVQSDCPILVITFAKINGQWMYLSQGDAFWSSGRSIQAHFSLKQNLQDDIYLFYRFFGGCENPVTPFVDWRVIRAVPCKYLPNRRDKCPKTYQSYNGYYNVSRLECDELAQIKEGMDEEILQKLEVMRTQGIVPRFAKGLGNTTFKVYWNTETYYLCTGNGMNATFTPNLHSSSDIINQAFHFDQVSSDRVVLIPWSGIGPMPGDCVEVPFSTTGRGLHSHLIHLPNVTIFLPINYDRNGTPVPNPDLGDAEIFLIVWGDFVQDGNYMSFHLSDEEPVYPRDLSVGPGTMDCKCGDRRVRLANVSSERDPFNDRENSVKVTMDFEITGRRSDGITKCDCEINLPTSYGNHSSTIVSFPVDISQLRCDVVEGGNDWIWWTVGSIAVFLILVTAVMLYLFVFRKPPVTIRLPNYFRNCQRGE